MVDAASVVAESAGSRRHLLGSTGLSGLAVRYVPDEHSLLDALVDLVTGTDPDILLGWEVSVPPLNPYALVWDRHLLVGL